jgi:hypothetical protein
MVLFDAGPVSGDPLRSVLGLQRDDDLDLGERDADLTEHRHQARLFELARLREAVGRVGSTLAGGRRPSSS